jgi:3-isopropylmalate/(R)-2-methylmalate dehydratase small subunit
MMERFTRLAAVAAPVALVNVNTDQIIPARFLRKPRQEGLGQFLFHDLRFGDDGRERPDFVLNLAPYRAARILVAERNFGCGSSREYAVLALYHHGIRAVIAPSFGDIFFNNCFKNGLLPIVLPEAVSTGLRAAVEARPGAVVIVDLAAQSVTGPDGDTHAFAIDGFRKHCLLEGVDELDFTRSQSDAIAAFETRQAAEMPWL